MNLFQHEDAITLGMLFWTNVLSKCKIQPSRESETLKSYPYPKAKMSTGRGGYYDDPCGDDGRVPQLDAKTGGSCLPGKGATPYRPGAGFHNGQFFQGGDGYGSSESAGAGGGVYGGGSSYMRSGGGGASSWCPAAYPHTSENLNVFHDRFDPEMYDVVNEPAPLHRINPSITETGDLYSPSNNWTNVYGFHKGSNTVAPGGFSNDVIEEELEMLLDLNTAYSFYYIWKYNAKSWYYSFEDYLKLFIEANGNGMILVSKPNEHIKWRHLKSEVIESVVNYLANSDIPIVGSLVKKAREILKIGRLDGIGQIINHTGGFTQEVTFKKGAVYEVILYGASGGNVGQWSPFDESYAGGFGGNQVCVIDLTDAKEDLTLYAVLGERGSCVEGVRAFNGGGSPSSGCTGGGGSTDLRYAPLNTDNTLLTRIAVAGGGGGIWGNNGACKPLPEGEGNSGRYEPPTPVIESGNSSIARDVYMVNDQSLVRVEFDAVISADQTEPFTYDLTIEIDEGQEGTLTKTVEISEPGHQVIIFDLADIYPPDTPTHQVTIETMIKREEIDPLPYFGITSETMIYIDTKLRKGESSDVPRNPLLLTCSDLINLVDSVTSKKVTPRRYEVEGHSELNIKDSPALSGSETEPVNKNEFEAYDPFNLEDTVELETKKINKIVIEASDDIALTDSVETEIERLLVIEIKIDDSGNTGSVYGAGLYSQGTEVTLEATPTVSGDTVEWYVDGVLVFTGETLVITVTKDIEYTVKFSSGSDTPEVDAYLVGSFDALANHKTFNDTTASVWQNILLDWPLIDTDEYGYSNDGKYDTFDALANGGSSETWVNKK